MSILTLFGAISCSSKVKVNGPEPNNSFYELKAVSLFGETIDFSQFKGKKVMIVNTASECGFTSQYEDLEKLYQTNKDNLVIIGFPANDFMNQEPGTNEEIAEFCRVNYGVSFTMSEKISVKGDDMHPVYKWLTKEELNGWNSQAPKWNFHKYLIDESGKLIGVFPSRTNPLNKKITSLL